MSKAHDLYEVIAPFLHTPALQSVRGKLVGAYIQAVLEESSGTVAKAEICEKFPLFSEAEIENFVCVHLPEVCATEIGGIPCWRDVAAGLPETFSTQVTEIVETLRLIERPVTPDTLDFALSLAYRENFRETYGLSDNAVFRRVVAAAYKGEGEVFPRKARASVRNSPPPEGAPITPTGRRTPTRFRDLGIPFGAVLAFVQDDAITCTVADDVSKVRYKGETLAISALASKLIGGSRNGFEHFRYEGETLWERRLRMEKEAFDGNR